ncbi:MAG TPA: hypothetical protein VGH70_16890 [Bradyrhizobium sp.]
MDEKSKPLSPDSDVSDAEDTNRSGTLGDPSAQQALSDEAARKRAREFDDALYAPLTCRAQSEQARALVDTVARLVTEHEQTAGTRTNKRHKKEVDLRVALEGFLADLLNAQASAARRQSR